MTKNYQKATYLQTLGNGLLEDFSWLEKSTSDVKSGIQIENNRDNLRALQSIVGNIGKPQSTSLYYQAQPLCNEQSGVLPSHETAPDINDLLEIATKRVDQLKQLQTIYPSTFNYTYYHWVMRYGSRLSGGELADTSLFDSNRIKAAMVSCLTRVETITKHDGLLLLKGDISGIQGFLYNEVAENREQAGLSQRLSKSLRGRSFYIALLTDFIAEELTAELGLEQANIIYSGGGNFMMLAPDTDTARTTVKAFDTKINNCLRAIGKDLGVLLGYVPCGENIHFDYKTLADDLNHKVLEKAKHQKGKAYLTDFMCKELKVNGFLDDEHLGRLAPYGNYIVEIKAKHPISIDHSKREYFIVQSFADFGTYYLLAAKAGMNKDKELTKIKSLLTRLHKEIHILSAKLIAINDIDFLKDANEFLNEPFPIGFGFRFVGRAAPKYEDVSITDLTFSSEKRAQRNNSGILTFEDLAELNQIGEGVVDYHPLAVMRLDIDDLGAIFGHGFLQNTTLDRIACLSREMHLFFSGYFNKIAAKHQLYVTYSGGDDAFVVGSWINMMHFAADLYKEFNAFTCNNEAVHFSAGIFLCNPHYPVSKFAEETGALESKAKGYINKKEVVFEKWNQRLKREAATVIEAIKDRPQAIKSKVMATKQALHLFNHTLDWEQYARMMDYAADLEQFVEQSGTKQTTGKLNRSLVQRLLAVIYSGKQSQNVKNGTGKMIFYQNIARLHYLFARQGYSKAKLSQMGEDDSLKKLIQELLQNIEKPEVFADYLIPAHYVLYKTRKSKS